jgi:cyclophilin family peptidyl-prolyl cis-trans isomerase
MNINVFRPVLTWGALALSAGFLAGCGGGSGSGSTLTFGASNVHYGKVAVFTATFGNVTSISDSVVMSANTSECTTAVATSIKNLVATFMCTPLKTGDLTITLKNSQGDVLGTHTVTVPEPQVTMTTTLGTMIFELNPTKAPITVKNFLKYVNSGFYTDTIFHRVIPGFMAQGGGFTTGLTQKTATYSAITLEANNGLSNTLGTVAMARTSVADSATSQFFVNLVDNSKILDYGTTNAPEGYAVFGKVISGTEVMTALGALETATINSMDDVPVTDVVIQSATQTQ